MSYWPGNKVHMGRLRIAMLAMLGACLFLVAALWRVQVAGGEAYERDMARQSIRRIRIPGQRGRIHDRHGMLLADNRPRYDVVVYMEEIRQPGPWARTIDEVERRLEEAAAWLGSPPIVSRQDIEVHVRRRLPLPLTAWRDLDDEGLARWAGHVAGMPGMDIHVEPVRTYPHGALAAHLLGYVGRAEPRSGKEDEPFHYYLPEIEGKTGLEKHFDSLLRGMAGGRLVRVDVSGFRHADMGGLDPVAGNHLLLALDRQVQYLVEKALDGYRGAAVVLDPRNGDVLALASSPAYDPNQFVSGLSGQAWSSLLNDPGIPLLNRAVAGQYPPGSIFKPVVAMAALQAGGFSPRQRWSCSGVYRLGRQEFRCWQRRGHGGIDLVQSIRYSCNVYFYHLGLQTGLPAIWKTADALGLGRRTGIDLDHELPGLLPDEQWKRRVMGEGWWNGDTCNLSIGQGFITVTPLQMAVVAAALANGGYVYRPRLLLGQKGPGEDLYRMTAPERALDLSWPAEGLRAVREGMREAVMERDGTGHRARVEHVVLAGKTGTAEYGPKGAGLKYAWMISFAPYDQPRFAVAMVVEEGEGGGATVAPLIRDVMQGLLQSSGGERSFRSE